MVRGSLSQVAPPRTGRRVRARHLLGARAVNLFYVPALAIFAIFTVYPLLSGAGLSFTNWNGYSAARSFIGPANYVRLLEDGSVRVALVNTFTYGFGSTIIQQVLGLGLALALDGAVRGKNFARAVIYLPALVSPAIMGTMYYLLFQYNNGVLNDVVGRFGGARVAWLSDVGSAIAIIVLINSLQFVGISMIIYFAGLQSIPTMYREAAMLDGAAGWKQFRYITVPLLQPAFATSIVLNLIGGLKLFDVIKVMTGGGPGYSTNSLSTFIGTTYFDGQSAGYASAMGIVLFMLIAVFALLMNALLSRHRLEQV